MINSVATADSISNQIQDRKKHFLFSLCIYMQHMLHFTWTV